MSLSPREWRERLAEKAKNRCGYCLTQEAVSGIYLTLEHIIHQSKNGKTEESNLWLSCRLCNESKGVLTEYQDPQSTDLFPLFNPYEQNWPEHFAWDEIGCQIVGLTPIGRATVAALNLNSEFRIRARAIWSEFRIRARAIWVEAGWHPPID